MTPVLPILEDELSSSDTPTISQYRAYTHTRIVTEHIVS